MPFDSPDVNLGDLLKDVATGRTQLPDFQREWKWDTDQIRSLLASISLGYPVGVVMTIEIGGDAIRFLPRPIEGVALNGTKAPDQLILDGQQRLTSLYQSLYSGRPVRTKDPRGKRLLRWYYLDMGKCLDPEGDREEAVVPVPGDHLVRNFRNEPVSDYSSIKQECAAEMFPLARVFDGPAINEWMIAYLQLDPDHMSDRLTRWNLFQEQVLKNFTAYTVPVIVLKRDTPKEAVCTVFEKVNTGGVILNVFELLTASFAAHDFRLNLDWKQRQERLSVKPALRSVESTDFLQAIALLSTHARRRAHLESGQDPATAPGISCRRRDILELTLTEYQKWAEPVTEALIGAADFLAGERIFQARDLPYRTQLVPLAAIRVALGSQAGLHGIADRLRRWYWCGVLGELYGGTTETRFARDLGEVIEWIKGGAEPQTVTEASFNPGRLLTLRTRNSAAYKGIYTLLMRDGCLDWLYDRPIDLASFLDLHLDIHHIFPKAWCTSHHVDSGRQESIVNKTAIASSTNRIIGGRAPSVYLPMIERRAEVSAERLDEILGTHAVDAHDLRHDDFDGFFAARTQALLAMIAAVMGKGIAYGAVESEGDFESEIPDIDDQDDFA